MDTTSSVRKLGAMDALGCMAFLALQSPLHRRWLVADMETNFVPALKAGQCKIYFFGPDNPKAFVTWALVDEERHLKLMSDGLTPHESKWASGDNLWFIDVVAPYGDAAMVIRDMRQNHFSGQNGYSIKRNPDGSINRIKKWRNIR
ncbi:MULTISPECIES: toxin-activating lysine-acyltransferase [unclassified Rhizobium]|uniref:toxin-activating lysine-acyltransferase n=1 Tax=unclassified Rhizobium TaxID=2613769 RepID=UPI000DE18203|nr:MULTISPECIES: toxin-activating lysine-acyltransferase [unclassified Rhizobium]MBB3286906.1 cytolysin-activating lysine-acyltransferase [Rhizobium sp. BK252]MBB3401646.1 cytolysin-activating lysine-acyltransferase [Rhizobium sp. BK289]MBB3414410.1 cytolysin-activating lysine-acyltransferase [Rhizobium sp. BK284]MBB3482298.1 cytolysin-activating lysine-acyltransferase [Rhizobium sp. BK347]MDK4718401.1 toxin-activating lysine-acyltransferase [Rhizobium sp. CNPSo 3968]